MMNQDTERYSKEMPCIFCGKDIHDLRCNFVKMKNRKGEWIFVCDWCYEDSLNLIAAGFVVDSKNRTLKREPRPFTMDKAAKTLEGVKKLRRYQEQN